MQFYSSIDRPFRLWLAEENASIDMALFGRMVADDVDLNVDATCQIAHSISTHLEFNSATLYCYATINVTDLFQKIGTDTPFP